ncbi:13701_t:CDS:1 [Entrophospora sp. SA101]|nr:13701_t:CDS:1 [Entrophospora sp. SA101]
MKAFDRERKGWNRDSLRNNTEIQKLRTHALQVINEHKQLQNENTNLISHNAQKDISLAESKAENITKSKKIRSLESMIKILEGKLSSAQKDVISIQKDSSKKESEILSLKSKIAELERSSCQGIENIKSELESKANELECLKSEGISKPIVGGDDGKNITKSDNISLGSTDLSKYFVCRKDMDQAGKIDGEITELSKNDTEIIPKVIDEIDISKNNNNILQEIPNVTPYLARPENNTPSLIRSHPQISMGGVEAIPVMASTLMSPLSAYIFLILLIITVMWFVRRTWNIGRLNEPLLRRPEGATLKGYKKLDRLLDTWIG